MTLLYCEISTNVICRPIFSLNVARFLKPRIAAVNWFLANVLNSKSRDKHFEVTYCGHNSGSCRGGHVSRRGIRLGVDDWKRKNNLSLGLVYDEKN